MSQATTTINEWLRANVEPSRRTIYRTDIARKLYMGFPKHLNQIAAHDLFPAEKIAENYRDIFLGECCIQGMEAVNQHKSKSANPYTDPDAAAAWARGWDEMNQTWEDFGHSR